MAASKGKKRVAIKHITVDNLEYPLVKTLRELKLMQYLRSEATKKSGMDIFFTGLKDLICPGKELAS